MKSPLEFSARAALCRQLAQREPDSKNLWLAEANRWSRLTREQSRAVMILHHGMAETWCWKAIRRRKPAEVQFEFRNAAKAADRDVFEELLSGLPLEAGELH
jgi:hypothetical protein